MSNRFGFFNDLNYENKKSLAVRINRCKEKPDVPASQQKTSGKVLLFVKNRIFRQNGCNQIFHFSTIKKFEEFS